ncbi:MAG: lamin tail domain-containing protein [Lentisphaerae bacterium]|nr:lamin tail domain-containing protein [Lentisphaerota bacterium]
MLKPIVALLLAGATAHAQLVSQNFDSWPTTGAWSNYTYQGWELSDGQVRFTAGGFGQTVGPKSAWLNDFDATSNTWIKSPLMPYGVDTVSFQARRKDGGLTDQFFTLSTSEDGTNWTVAIPFDRLDDTWIPFSYRVNVTNAVYVRIAKTGDQGDLQYLGLDDIQITPPPGVALDNLRHVPNSPSSVTPVHVYLEATAAPISSNLVLKTWYRPGTSGAFTNIAMSIQTNNTYRTAAPIPSGFLGIVQYFVSCDYTGTGVSPLFSPPAGSNSPAQFDTSNPYLNSSFRQLEPSSRRTPFILSEIMYHPSDAASTSSLEYVELFNTEALPHDLGGFQLAGDVSYTFPTGTVLGARSFALVAADPSAMQAAYGLANVFGPFAGNLPNNSGTVRLLNNFGAILLETTYSDQSPWPVAADGTGHSLALHAPDFGEGDAAAWRTSRLIGGSPGDADPTTTTPLDAVVINEFLAHTDLPDVDYVELFNTSTQNVDISGCTLSDSPSTNEFTIPPGTILAPLGFIAFAQTNLGFSLSSHGDDLYFGAADHTRIIDAARFPAQINGVPTGRFPDGAADFYTLGGQTPGTSNTPAGRRRESVIINEIMYHPISGDSDDEYVELYNQDSNAVDVGYWRFVSGIDYTLPPGTVIPPHGYLVVARNVTNLLARYSALGPGHAVGDFSGRLADGGERVALARPDDLALPYEDFVPVNEVCYGDGREWGRWTDGGGSSLELVDPRADNRLPMNWAGSDETTKAPWTTVNVTNLVDNGSGTPNELRTYILQGGECLIDNLAVKLDDGTTLLNETFESGLGAWTLYGNHSRTGIDNTQGYASAAALRLRASSGGNEGVWSGWTEAFLNHARTPLLGPPVAGTNVIIQAKVRWLAGWPHMVLALRGFWAEAAVRMDLPPNLGTPGQPNSRLRANNGPAISDLAHSPVLPAAAQPALVSCRVDDPDGVAAARLYYRIEPTTNYTLVAMNDSGTGGDLRAGDGCYSAAIPGQVTGARAAFYVEVVDAAASAQTNAWPGAAPTGAPRLEGIARFGQTLPPGVLGRYILWITDVNVNRWQTIPGGTHSNEPIDLTLVYGGYRVIYNAGGRYRGLWRPYGSPVSSGGYSVEHATSARLLGATDFDLDQIGQNGGDGTAQSEGFAYWSARDIGLQSSETRYVRVNVNGTDRTLLHDLQTPGGDFYESRYEDPDPVVFKLEGWVGDPFIPMRDGHGNFKQSRYRWLLEKRPTAVPNDDYDPVYDLVEAAATVTDATYEARLRALLDVRAWTGAFAAYGALIAWDHYGFSYTHNGFAYLPHERGGGLALYDLDHVMASTGLGFPSASWPVPTRMLNRPVFSRVYYAVAKDLADGPFTAAKADARLDALYNIFLASGVSVGSPAPWKSWAASQRSAIAATVAPFNAPFAITTGGGTNFSTTNVIVTLAGTTPLAMDRIRVNGVGQAISFTSITNWSLCYGLDPGTNALMLTAHDWRGNLIASNAIAITLTQPPPSPVDQIVITEIMYGARLPADDFVEVFNRSATTTFDLRGWRLNGIDCTFQGGSLLEPRAYGIIAANKAAYQHAYGNAETILGTYPGSLDNGGENLQLLMPAGSNAWVTIDEVHYDDDPPWPTEAANGQSLQLVDINQDNNRPGNWRVAFPTLPPQWTYVTVTGIVNTASPVQLNQAKLYLYLEGPGQVAIDSMMLVTGTVAGAGANLLLNGDFEGALSGPWSALGTHAASFITTTNPLAGAGALAIVSTGPGNISNTIVQARSLNGHSSKPITLSFWLLARPQYLRLTVDLTFSSLHGSIDFTPTIPVLNSAGTSNVVAAVLPEFPPLWINEVMPSNVTAWADNHAEFDPWIELYNGGTQDVDLTDFRLSNAYDDPGRWAFPSGTVIAAGSRLLIWADGSPGQDAPGYLHTSFALNPVTGTVVLARAYLNTHLVLDDLPYAFIGQDFSFGDYPDGDPLARQVFHTPTPGQPNSLASLPLQVAINEWMAQNNTTLRDPSDQKFEDWFELFNPSSQPVNLGGYYLTDDLDLTNQFRIPGGSFIAPRSFMLVWADGEDGGNAPGLPLHTNFKLSAGGEAIALYRPDGVLVDAVTFGPQAADHSEGCWPDGTPAIYSMQPPTPGASNAVLQVASVAGTTPSAFALQWNAQSGGVYQLHFATNLVVTNWSMIGVVTAQAPTLSFVDTNAADHPVGFYRLQRAP